jgi:hypothetical protein
LDLSTADLDTESKQPDGFKTRALAWLAADRKRRYWVLVLFIAALLVRLHWNLRVHPLDGFLYSDMKGYWGRADALLDNPFSVGEYQAFFPFGTTWLMAGIKAVFGRDALGAVSVIYAIFGASVVAASYAIADRISCNMGAPARWVAPAVGLFLLVYYPLLAIGGYILSELPFCFCLMISVLLLMRLLDDDGRPRDAWLLGTMLGIGALFRPQILLSVALVGVLWLLMFVGSRRGKPNPYARLSWAMLGRVAVPLLLLLTMSSIRYYAHTKQLGLVSGNGSINLVFGRCHNKGIYSRPDGEGHATVRFSPPPLIQLEIHSAKNPDSLFQTRSVWGDNAEPVEGVPGFAVDSYGCKRRKCHQPGSEIEYRGYIGDQKIHRQIVRSCIERGGLARQAYFTATHWVMLWRLNVMWPDQPAAALHRAARDLALASAGLGADPPRHIDGACAARARVRARASAPAEGGAGRRQLLGAADPGWDLVWRHAAAGLLRSDHHAAGRLLLCGRVGASACVAGQAAPREQAGGVMSLALELLPERAFLRRIDTVPITELPGFVRGRHRLPSEHGRAAEQFLHSLVAAALADEVRAVYEAAKQLLGLRRRELIRAVAEGGGNVDAPQFRFVLELGLDPRDVTRALWQRRVSLQVDPHALPSGFDEVFPIACDELVIPFARPGGDHARAELFDQLVDRLEDFAESHGGAVEEDEDRGRAGLTTRDGSRVALDLAASELSLRILGVAGARELMLESRRRFAELTGAVLRAGP